MNIPEFQNTAWYRDEARQIEKNRPGILAAKLLFRAKPEISREALLTEIGLHFKEFSFLEVSNGIAYEFPEYAPLNGKEKTAPGCHLVMPEDEIVAIDVGESAHAQNWTWPEGSQIARECTYELAVWDHNSLGLDHMNRLNLFNCFLMATIRALSPLAVYSLSGNRLLHPGDLVQALGGQNPHILEAVVNLRIFPGSATQNMDTLGMYALGLPDFSMEFESILANEYAMQLWNYCYTVYQNGDMLLTGHSLPGLLPQQRMQCTRKISETPPERVVIELRPA